jgi:trimeric autotransporter adhesin
VKKPTITVGGTSYDNVAAAIDAVAKNGGGTGNADAVAYDTGSSKATVSFGGASGTVLKNVAAGMVDASSKEAINGSQLYAAGKSVADAIGGGATVGKDGTVSKPSITVGGNNYASVADAIGAVDAKTTTGNTLGVAYDDASKGSITLNKGGSAVTLKNVANATKDDEAVNLAQLKSAGLATDSGTVLDAVAYDAGSSKASISFAGANGTVLNNVADGRIEAGSRQAVNGGQIAAIKDALEGKITNIDNHVTKVEQHGTGGGFTTNGNGGSMIGDQTTASGKDSVAIGNGASITETGSNSVALGNGSVADRADTVSVGSEGHERTISNVADGTAPTDAINLRQLNQSTASANAYTDKMINDVWSNLSEEIDHSNRQANRGIAAASALINVTPYIPGHVTVNAGVAGYRGESALGVGVSRWSENGRVNLNAGVSAAQGDEAVFRVGIGYIF